MKFSNTLEFNAVREWSEHYVAYERLKRKIYEMEIAQAQHWQRERKRRAAGEEIPAAVLEPLLLEKTSEFVGMLEAELERVNGFYREKEAELREDVRRLEESAARILDSQRRRLDQRQQTLLLDVHGSGATAAGSTASLLPRTESIVEMPLAEDLDGAEDSRQRLLPPTTTKPSPKRRVTLSQSQSPSPLPMGGDFSQDFDQLHEFRTEAKDTYVNLCSLKEYVVLNYTAFFKILKKFDKVLYGHPHLRPKYMPVVENSYFWTQNVDSARHAVLNDAIDRVVSLFANVVCEGNMQRALSELGHLLREYVIWERNTIWRDMVGKERRVTAVGVKRVAEREPYRLRVPVPFIRRSIVVEKRVIFAAMGALLFALLLEENVFAEERQNKCFALLGFASFLWATEALPLFVTSMLIPFFVIVLDIWNEPDAMNPYLQVPTEQKAKIVIGKMLSPVILLLLGGFSIAAALSKFHIAKSMATLILSRAGTQSKYILLAILFVATFSSMWISNVAAPVLCFSVIQPILRTLEPGNQFAKSLVMGIALASNVGGMVTPISSPQNAIGLGNMSPAISWPVWLGITVPLAICSNMLCWLALLFVYRPSLATPRIQPIRASMDKFTLQQYYIIFVTLFTIVLWCLETPLKGVFGYSGVIAIIPMVAFFATGILSKDDFNNFLWTVVMLAMGGIVLGETVRNTKLLFVISDQIQQSLGGSGVWVALVVFCGLALVAATFVSHTVSALIILPIVKEVGEKMGGKGNILVMGTMLMCSGAMGLPISGFPNINAVSLEDPTGMPYVGTLDFLKVGVPISVVVYGLTITLGYGLMMLFGV